MTLPPSVLSEGVLRIDWTRFSGILRCWRYGWHQVAHKRVLAARDEAQGFGSAIHAALDARRRGDGEAQVEQVLTQAFAGVELPEDEHRTLGRARETIQLYAKEYATEPFEVLETEHGSEKELGVVEIGALTCRIFWQGRTDAIVRDPRNGRPAVFDTKTAENAQLDIELLKYRLGGQFPMYCWLESDREWGKINDAVEDLIIVRKPLAKVLAKSLPRTEFHRLTFHYTDEQIEECKRDTLKILQMWLNACAQPEPPPMNRSACTLYRKACPYASVCENAREEDRMKWLLSGAYVEDTFNPLDTFLGHPALGSLWKSQQKLSTP